MENSQITKYSESPLLPQALSLSEKEFIALSAEGKKVKDYAPDNLLKFIANLMFNAKLRLNHSTGFKDEEGMQRMIALDLRRNFSGLTDEEIKKAVTLGLNGEFAKKPDEVILFSPANLTKWLKAYIGTKKQPAMAKLLSTQKAAETIVPDMPTQLQNFKTALLYHFNKIKESGEYYEFDFGNAFYFRLESLKLISCDASRRWQIYEQEKQNLMLHPEIKDKNEKSIYADWLKNLEEKGTDTSNKFEIRLKSLCRRRILKEHIQDWIESEVDLEEILDNAIANYNLKSNE